MLKFAKTLPSEQCDRSVVYDAKRRSIGSYRNNSVDSDFYNIHNSEWTALDEKLYSAIRANNCDLVLNLFFHRENSLLSPVKLNPNGDSSLHLCCELGFSNILSVLMNSPLANINSTDSKNRTPLHRALGAKQTAVGKTLLKNGANTDAADSKQMTPLHIAAANGDTECVEIMVSGSASLEVKNKDGKTALAVAASRNQIDVADVLLNSRANVNATDSKGRTPLMLAAQNGFKEMVDFLVVRDADTSLTDNSGKNFIQLANEAGNSLAVAAHVSKNHLGSSTPPAENQPAVMRKNVPRVPLMNPPPINPPRRRNSKLDPSPFVEIGSPINEGGRQSQLSTCSSSSSSSLTNKAPPKPDSKAPSLCDSPLLERKESYLKQLESKNAELIRQQIEMQNKMSALLSGRERESQVPPETTKKIEDLEDTVKGLMQALESRVLIRQDFTPLSLLNGDQTPQSTNNNSPSTAAGLLKTTEHVSNGNSSNNGTEGNGSFLNYYNMSSLMERQRHSQSSDSGYGGVSPTSSRGSSRIPLGALSPQDIRSELSSALLCLKELTNQQVKMQHALEVQSKAIGSVTKTILSLEQALHLSESANQITSPRSTNQQGNNFQGGGTSHMNGKVSNRISVFENHV